MGPSLRRVLPDAVRGPAAASETAQNRKINYPRPAFLERTRVAVLYNAFIHAGAAEEKGQRPQKFFVRKTEGERGRPEAARQEAEEGEEEEASFAGEGSARGAERNGQEERAGSDRQGHVSRGFQGAEAHWRR